MKPIIAITPQYDSRNNLITIKNAYSDAIFKSGGIPIALQLIRDGEYIKYVCNFADGILFTGGKDIDPRYYGEEIDEKCGEIDNIRDEFEISLYCKAAKQDMPILGICRGTQLINICEGGKCHQHIAGHDNTTHSVKINRDSLLYKIIGKDELSVNSFHHQASSTISSNMQICAAAGDNTVEAVFKKNVLFNLSVQWHPERTYDCDTASKSIFDAFIKAAKKPC